MLPFQVATQDKVAYFLYLLLRDELPAGAVERIARECLKDPLVGGVEFSNGFLGQYAVSLAEALKDGGGNGPLVYGATPRSSRWGKVRAAHLAKRPVCAACGTTRDLAVHHIKPYHLFPELELDPTNLMTLCELPGRNCHFRVGHCFDWQAWNPEAAALAGTLLAAIRDRKEER